jgi:hypothetical protein
MPTKKMELTDLSIGAIPKRLAKIALEKVYTQVNKYALKELATSRCLRINK